MTRESPSGRGRFSARTAYAAGFSEAARRALARAIRFSFAARPRRTCGFIARYNQPVCRDLQWMAAPGSIRGPIANAIGLRSN